MHLVCVDGRILPFKNFYSVYQFCNVFGYKIPSFCYQEKLFLAGNCRICLVEVNGALVISCAIPLLP